MSNATIAGMLADRFGFTFTPEQVEQTGSTETSTLYTATDDTGHGVEVEVFGTPVDSAVGEEVNTLNSRLALAAHPGAFQPRSVGTTEDGKLFVLREAPTGTPLSDLIAEKGATFTAQEVRDLLAPVAEAIDDYDLKGLSGFVARSITPERLLVQPQWSSTPVKLTLVGPSTDPAGSDEEAARANVEKFANVVALMTGEQPRDGARTCAGVLETAPAEQVDIERPDDSVAPRPQDGYRKPPEPYAYGADGSYARPEEPKKSTPWPWIIAILALLLIALGALWYWSTHRGEEWTGAEAQIAEAYPKVVSERAGLKGWKDLTCESGSADVDQVGKIRCANESLGVSVAQYATQADRDDAVPDPSEAVVLGSGECTIYSYELPDATPPAFVMTPQDKPEYLFIVNGDDAENQRLDLPVCE
ncbi:hypothetical protein GC584_08225 [Corynebacterium sp. zg912]|uniref:Protein kinase domain-containing protein n=1 Tax=Corynebacterium wankanglinii TaxID=2735136 RepID=A0A7V8UVI5_9CORY|nr:MULTISPECIES: hypothetical protein [Corynebacterium]MBA1838129.1 hypothetical protein [Corynebacterium wankanglinii]MCR5929397.1 hypothetical protein [Corynebacterium sp. zg912]